MVRRFGLAALILCSACGALLDLPPLELVGDDGGPPGGGDDGSTPSADGPANETSACGDTTSNPQSCGRCGHVCPGKCERSECTPVVLAAVTDTITALAQTPTEILYSTVDALNDQGEIRRCAKSGCNQTASLVATDTRPEGLSVDDTHVAWIGHTITNGFARSCTIATCASSGVSIPIASGQTAGITIAGGLVVYSDSSDLKLYSCPLAGCATQATLETGILPVDMHTASDGTTMVFLMGGPRVARRSVTAGPVTDIAFIGNNAFLSDLAIAGKDAAWIENAFSGGGGTLFVRAIDGSGTTKTISTDAPSGVAGDAQFVYFDFASTGAVVRCPHDACPKPEPVAFGLDSPTRMLVDENWVYVATKKGVVQLAKP
jgi:hypothetical protein